MGGDRRAAVLPEGLTERASTFALRDVVAAFAGSLRPGAPAGEVEARALAYLARPEVVALADGRHTTRDMLAVERAALATVARRRRDGRARWPRTTWPRRWRRGPPWRPSRWRWPVA